MNKICISVFSGFTYQTLLPAIKDIGFDGFFTDEQTANNYDELKAVRSSADKLGLDFETSHSTIPGCHTIWYDGNEGDEYIKILKNNIDNCKSLNIPILVVHIQIDKSVIPTLEIGLKRLTTVIEYAVQSGVKIAFENINSSELLFDVLKTFKNEAVGFCYDCGHEAIYTPETRFLPLLGDRLLCTHIHDNNLMHDNHFIPFDGSIDFNRICDELRACGYKGNITLELCYNDFYKQKYDEYEFLNKSFQAAKRLAERIN